MTRFPFAFFLLAPLGACGTYVPEIQEIGDAREGQKLVQSIATNVKCEVQDAIADIYSHWTSTFIDTWGVQVTLTLTIDEKGAVSPSTNWMPPSPATAVFGLAAGATASSDATRTDKLNMYYTVQELRNLKDCDPRNRPGGLFLMQSDLKLKEWLYDVMSTSGTGTSDYRQDTTGGPFKQNVISHEVKFEVLSSGNLTPTWKLTRVSVNPSGSLLSASRDRTHDLLITFGPTLATPVTVTVKGKPRTVMVSAPTVAATNSHLASEIGVAVSTNIRNSLQP